jgi:hypothetical protein
MARPTSYTPEMARRICEELASSGSLRAVCRNEWAPNRSTITRWVVDNVNGFAAEYARAKELGIDDFVEETLEIADEDPARNLHGVDSGAVAHAKVRIETRRWLAERMLPRKYGSKSGLELTGSDGGPVKSQITIVTGVPHPDDFEDLA